MLKRLATVAAGLAVVTNAHMFISSPAPIDGSAPKSPLDASGSNFPCHGAQLPTSGGESMAAGSSQLLAWELASGANTAVHGGGSCQISITYETDPAKVKDPKNWYVIYSIEGGCPSNTHQNLDGSYRGPSGNTYTGSYSCDDPSTNGVDCVNSFNFTIPKGAKNGHAILAWTWFNSVGNREMYMNCVNTQLTGGDGSEMAELPSMFVANMASVNQCPTTQSVDLQFPFPGKYVTTKKPSGEAAKTAITFPMSTPSGQGCASNGAPAGGAAPAAPVATSDAAPASSPVAPTDAQPTGQVASLVTATSIITVTANPGATSAPASAPATSPSANAPSPSASSGAGDSPATSTCPSGQVSCSSPGSIICIGSNRWAECDVDNCAVPMALAPGTSCKNGVISKRSMRHLPR